MVEVATLFKMFRKGMYNRRHLNRDLKDVRE